MCVCGGGVIFKIYLTEVSFQEAIQKKKTVLYLSSETGFFNSAVILSGLLAYVNYLAINSVTNHTAWILA
jgi:hypothetical protein